MARNAPTVDMSHDKPMRNYSGRYLDYLNDHTRRLRKAVGTAPNDAAGLLGGSRYHGRETPVKGKGLPPAEDKEEQSQQHKHTVAGRSYQPSDVLLLSRPTTADDLLYRTSRRTYGRDLKSGLQGAAARVIKEVPDARLSRGRGALAPDRSIHTTTKHLNSCGSIDMDAALHGERSGLRTFISMRPNTADNVIRHRYSDPDTDARPAKLDCARTSTPNTKNTDAGAERAVFFDAFQEYCRNKTRALYGGIRRFH